MVKHEWASRQVHQHVPNTPCLSCFQAAWGSGACKSSLGVRLQGIGHAACGNIIGSAIPHHHVNYIAHHITIPLCYFVAHPAFAASTSSSHCNDEWMPSGWQRRKRVPVGGLKAIDIIHGQAIQQTTGHVALRTACASNVGSMYSSRCVARVA